MFGMWLLSRRAIVGLKFTPSLILISMLAVSNGCVLPTMACEQFNTGSFFSDSDRQLHGPSAVQTTDNKMIK
jgi:hypothetical protein